MESHHEQMVRVQDSLSDSKDEKILLRSSVVYQKCALGVGFGGVVRQLVRGICNSMPIKRKLL